MCGRVKMVALSCDLTSAAAAEQDVDEDEEK